MTDAENVGMSVNSDSLFARWEYRKLVRDIKFLLNSFNFWSVTRVKRDNNNLADMIAKKMRKDRTCLEELHNVPSCLETFIGRHIMLAIH